MMSGKIGLGLITCNAVEKFKQSVLTVPEVDAFVIVNDGLPYESSVYPTRAVLIQHDKNYSVGKSKNDALRYLFEQGCEHIFLMEDDVLIKNPEIINKYIRASETTGLLHFNYALQGSNNRKPLFEKKNKLSKLYDSLFNSQKVKADKFLLKKYDQSNAEPNPKAIIEFENNISISLYPHCVGAFSYYRNTVIEKVGYMDETFKNAWEHVEHTYQICALNFHTPFWWFADVTDSKNDIDNIVNVIETSTIRNNPNWNKNSIESERYFIKKIGCKPSKIPQTSKAKIASFFKKKNALKIRFNF